MPKKNQIITGISSFLLSSLLLFYSWKLDTRGYHKLKLSFFSLAFSFFLSGIYHGLYENNGTASQFSNNILMTSWVSGAFAQYLLTLVLISHYNLPLSKFFKFLGLFFTIVNTVLSIKTESFFWISLNFIPLVLFGTYYALKYFQQKFSVYLLIGLSILILGSLVQAFKIKWLWPIDHNGLYHILLLIGLPFLYNWTKGLKTKERSLSRT